MFGKKTKNTGKQYENLLIYVYEQLSYFSGKDIKVERNVKLKGKSGVVHQIDVYYQFEMNGIMHKVVIECKDHKQKVEKSMIQSFKGVLDDLGNCVGIFASRNGFQSGAIEFAKHYDIELITGGELPLLSKVIAKKVATVLPNQSIVGQPFWTIMEEVEGKVTGTYICVSDKTIGLFMSKKCAEEIAKRTGGVVRGVCQKHLRIILGYARMNHIKVCMSILNPNQGMLLEPKAIEDYFIV
jgi:hypothetical protein